MRVVSLLPRMHISMLETTGRRPAPRANAVAVELDSSEASIELHWPSGIAMRLYDVVISPILRVVLLVSAVQFPRRFFRLDPSHPPQSGSVIIVVSRHASKRQSARRDGKRKS